MRAILTGLLLGIAVAAVASPAALAADDERDSGGNDRVVTITDRDTPQINVGVVAGSDDQAPVVEERYEKN